MSLPREPDYGTPACDSAQSVSLLIDGVPINRGGLAAIDLCIQTFDDFTPFRVRIREGTVHDPGDVIATGTPAGLAASHTPPAWLVPGATVSMTLDGLGTLTSPIRVGAPFLD